MIFFSLAKKGSCKNSFVGVGESPPPFLPGRWMDNWTAFRLQLSGRGRRRRRSKRRMNLFPCPGATIFPLPILGHAKTFGKDLGEEKMFLGQKFRHVAKGQKPFLNVYTTCSAADPTSLPPLPPQVISEINDHWPVQSNEKIKRKKRRKLVLESKRDHFLMWTCPTNNGPLINFRLNSDAETLLLSTKWAYQLAPNVQKSVCNVYTHASILHTNVGGWGGKSENEVTVMLEKNPTKKNTLFQVISEKKWWSPVSLIGGKKSFTILWKKWAREPHPFLLHFWLNLVHKMRHQSS